MMSILQTMQKEYSKGSFPQPFLLREESKSYIKHDLIFKQLIQALFKEFMETFFPKFSNKSILKR